MKADDPVLSHRVRTGALAFLSDRGAADFVELATALEVANNTLSSHLQRLESASYVELRRGFLGRKPRTRVVMTGAGREAWLFHLEQIGTERSLTATKVS